LELIVLTSTKQVIPLPEDIEADVLQSVMVLLVTVNINDTLSTRSYLQPLDGHENIYKFSKPIGVDQQQTNIVIFYIGKYGTCPVAIGIVPPVLKVLNSANTVPIIANQCFPNLGAIISVGTACGIERKVKMCDVLVSSKIVNYNEAYNEHLPIAKGEVIAVMPQLIKLFTQFVQCPNDTIKKRLKDNGMPMPDVKSGTILSGLYCFDDPTITKRLIKNFASDTIGIEMERTHLFTANQEATTNIIIVKAVCDFGNRRNYKVYQPTAALLAADLVHKCLSDPQAPEMFKGLSNLFESLIVKYALTVT